jgi:hypothetical protein
MRTTAGQRGLGSSWRRHLSHEACGDRRLRRDCYKATALGELTLPSVTGIGMGWWVLVFIAILAFSVWGMATLEHLFRDLRPKT